LIAAADLVVGLLVAVRYPLRPIDPQQLLPAGDWPAPYLLDADTEPSGPVRSGPVQVRVEYPAQHGQETEFLAALSELRYGRRRTGASSRRVWQDPEQVGVYVEIFMLASCNDQLRQHERVTVADRARQQRVRDLVDPEQPPTVTHLIAARTDTAHHLPV
jgi:hypothetical protein